MNLQVKVLSVHNSISRYDNSYAIKSLTSYLAKKGVKFAVCYGFNCDDANRLNRVSLVGITLGTIGKFYTCNGSVISGNMVGLIERLIVGVEI
jgi:hypothetical protein